MVALKKKGTLKKRSSTSQFSSDREFAVVLESIEGKLNLVAEVVSENSRKIDVLTEDVRVLKDDVTVLKVGFRSLNGKVKIISSRVDVIDVRTEAMYSEMKGQRKIVDDHEKRIGRLETICK